MIRTPTEVIHDHLSRRLEGDVEGDIRANFADDVILLSGFGTFRGWDGIRQSAQELAVVTSKDGTFAYHRVVIEEGYGFLEWTARSAEHHIDDGVDSFHVVDGKIVMQTVHFTALNN